MSDEDTLAREDAVKHVDSKRPMALEASPVAVHKTGLPESGETALENENPIPPSVPETPKPKRRTKAEIEADKAAKVLAAEQAKQDREIARTSQKGYKMALTLAERERKKAETARKREEAKAQRAQERVQAKIDAKREKITEAEGGLVELPAAVLRDGTVTHVSDVDAWSILEMHLDELGMDSETSGYPPGHRLYEHRTIQLGGEHMVVVFDMADPHQRDVASLALHLAKKIRSFSSVADNVPAVLSGLISWDDVWDKTQDAVLNVKLNDPKMSGSSADALKDLSRDLLREYAVSPNAEKAKNELFKAMGTTTKPTLMTEPDKNGWYSVNRNSVVMTRYAGSDVLDMMAVLRVLPPIPAPESVIEREREFGAAVAPVSLTGFKLDHDHIKMKIAEAEAAKADALENVKILSQGRIVNPKSSDVLKVLPELIPGLVLPVDRNTKRPTAGKEALESLSRDYPESQFPAWHHLFKQIARYRREDTKLGLLLRPLEALCEHGDGRMRPTVYTIEASTGRSSCVRPNGQQFCYTSSMDILTDQGWKAFPLIDGSERVAQWRDGLIEFVIPEAVLHEPYDGQMIKIWGEHHEQVVTPAHRVYSVTRASKLMIERADSWLKHGAVDKIVDRKLIRGGRLVGRKLTNQEKLSLYRAVAVQADGHLRNDCKFVQLSFTKRRKAERAQALGWEVRLSDQERGGKKVYIAKAYGDDFKPWLNLPEKTFNVPALLELDASDLEDFLHEVMIWDGDSTRLASYNQAMERAEAVDAVEMAAFLSGNSTCRSVKHVAGKDYANVQVFPETDRWASRTNVEKVPSDGMIHCVTVPSGAVVVRSSGKVIISGNSRQGGIRACVVAGEAELELIDGQWVIVSAA